jgi:hypothetical protein
VLFGKLIGGMLAFLLYLAWILSINHTSPMGLLLFFAMYISSDYVSSDMRTIYGLDLSELNVSDSFTFCSVLLRTELMLQLRDKSLNVVS